MGEQSPETLHLGVTKLLWVSLSLRECLQLFLKSRPIPFRLPIKVSHIEPINNESLQSIFGAAFNKDMVEGVNDRIWPGAVKVEVLYSEL